MIDFGKEYYKKEYDFYCYQIFCEIQNEEFRYAKFDEEQIVFYDEDFEELFRKEYKKYNSHFKIVFIENDENTMSFWKSRFLDDGIGIVYIKDDKMNSILSGLKKLERSGGSSYWFGT